MLSLCPPILPDILTQWEYNLGCHDTLWWNISMQPYPRQWCACAILPLRSVQPYLSSLAWQKWNWNNPSVDELNLSRFSHTKMSSRENITIHILFLFACYMVINTTVPSLGFRVFQAIPQRKEVTAPTAQVTFKYRTLNPNNFILCYEHFLIYLYHTAFFSFFFRNWLQSPYAIIK